MKSESLPQWYRCVKLSLLVIFSLAITSNCWAQDQNPDKKKQKKVPKPASIVWVNHLKKSQTLPDNTQHLTFKSELVKQDIGYCIYLPPSYADSPSKRFPVIYNLHGNGGNEFTGREAIALLHDGITDGRWPEIIMVLPNGGQSTFYKNSADGKLPIESIFMTEFIPFIDKTYRTIAERKGRCIEGFSMGGRGSTRLAMKYPEMFCSLFCQAGNVPHLLESYDEATPEQREKLLLGPDRAKWEADDVYAVTKKNAARIKTNVRIQIACGTQDGGHLPSVRDFHEHLKDLEIDHTYIEIEGLGHKRQLMMKQLESIWFDYHVESLRRASK